MTAKKDMRREDLIVPYIEADKEKTDTDLASTMASTLPMAAIFTRNKMIGWAALLFAVQTWLSETPEKRRASSTPGYLSIGMAFLALMTAYMPLFLPPQAAKPKAGSGTEAAPAVPPR